MDVCVCFRRIAMRKLIYPKGKIFVIVDIHFGKREKVSVTNFGGYYEVFCSERI